MVSEVPVVTTKTKHRVPVQLCFNPVSGVYWNPVPGPGLPHLPNLSGEQTSSSALLHRTQAAMDTEQRWCNRP
jgi:hypothetical protein